MKAKLTYLGAGIGLIAGFILYLISDFFLFLVILGPMVGFLSYDYRLYRKQKLKLEEEAKKAQEEQQKKEQKRHQNDISIDKFYPSKHRFCDFRKGFCL